MTMATVYVKFNDDEQREKALKMLFDLKEDDGAAKIFMEKVREGQQAGGLTLGIGYVKNPLTDYQKLTNKIAEHGISGIRFQKQYRGQKASWLAIRVLSTDHQKLLEKGLADMGMEIG